MSLIRVKPFHVANAVYVVTVTGTQRVMSFYALYHIFWFEYSNPGVLTAGYLAFAFG